MKLNNRTITIILNLDEKPQSWKDMKLYFSYMGWNNVRKMLVDKGIIEESGIDEKGRKIWKLTNKGKKLAYYIKKIKELLY